ncbi:Inositol-pentakisphosphate 2-kinase [Rhodotorula toruloides ATCC 204091]|nr:Inositol-pentakisphosphate 2-kinase [Rhodotorula toruloides ATCC 204091]KAK4332670.1 Inositol-pentakisphosphate 2-kinase [Rhodotorula toruloides]PRQ74033.1 inositol-pentakisphosphate 2-kinase [Rhodotorula toruloides]
MPLPPLETTSPSDWKYTAEGGANLVASFAGPASSPFWGHALRLRKRKKRAGGTKEAEDAVPSEVDVDFGARVIAPLLGEANVVEMEKVRLERGWLEELVEDMRAKAVRPVERESEDEIDLDAPEGVVVEDLIAGRGVLAVEIKPKWGFLPSPTHLSPSNASIKTTYCRTCMHRHYKASEDGGSDGFCPLDLYSGDPPRVHKALEQLHATWVSSEGAINNLRIFLDGKKVLPGDASQAAALNQAFHHLTATISPASPVSPATLFARALAPTLLHSPALPLLRDLQSLLDVLDIEGLASFLSRTTGVDLAEKYGPEEVERLGGQPRLEEWVEWVGRYAPVLGRREEEEPAPLKHDEWERAKATLESRFLASATPDQDSPTPPWREAILAYLLSATFKDCSLIIRLPLDLAASTVGTVKAIDLDPKPINRLGKYFRMDREIVECWKERLERSKTEGRAGEVRKCSEA